MKTSILRKALINNASMRAFASKHSKGSFGKEQSLGSNFSFPKHKELFADHYYRGDPEHDVQEEDDENSFID